MSAADKLTALTRGAKFHAIKAKRAFNSFPAHNKVGIGLSLTSLGLGIANYRNSNQRVEFDATKADIDKKSLSALQKIHKALVQSKATTQE